MSWMGLVLGAATAAGCSVAPPMTQPKACDEPGTVCTVAGTGLAAFEGDGKLARDTTLYYPYDIVFDDSGRPLLNDWNNLRVRRINADGRVETLIGKDFESDPVDGALAVDLALHHASDIEFDNAGRLFLAGDHSPTVFYIDTDDRVRLLAGTGDNGNTGDGGPARQATFGTPYGVAPDGLGGCYVADEEHHVVRYIDPEGIITTVAGNGTRGYTGDGGPATAAQLSSPTRLRIAPDGALLICDTRNHAIRRVDAAGLITTFAGNGEAAYTGDGGQAADAQLNRPFDLAYSPAGNLYVADSGNQVIRRIRSDGIIETVAGNGTMGFSGDEGPALEARMNRPSGVTFAPDGSLWICDTFNQRVRRVAPPVE
jgi:hypothetical protein